MQTDEKLGAGMQKHASTWLGQALRALIKLTFETEVSGRGIRVVEDNCMT
jgi:hypothetical protein